MQKMLKSAAILSLTGAVLSTALFCRFREEFWLAAAITMGTTAYHLWMRLLIGLLCSLLRTPDCTGVWYRLRPWEEALFRTLRVKRWKALVPTYRPEQFSPKVRTWTEIAQAMCRAELGHELNLLLSFLPLAASRWFGAFPVFLITSLFAAGLEAPFILVQRYNRPRVIPLALREKTSRWATPIYLFFFGGGAQLSRMISSGR